MEIYYIDIEKFKKQRDKSFLEPYNDIGIKNEKRFFEYTIGRYLVKSVAKSVYNLKNLDILTDNNGKPYFAKGGLYFNISHSKNIVLACFDSSPCGIDVEYMKDRNLEKFSKYYKEEFNNLEEFYRFWTLKEAKYKLGSNPTDIYSSKFNENYWLTYVVDKNK